jgi:hypothetical protein
MADKMTTQKTTFENKPYSALFINGPCESRNVGIKLYFRYQLSIFVYITWYHPHRGRGGVVVSGGFVLKCCFLGSHFVRHFVTLNDILRMANIDFWIQRPWNRVKRYAGLNTNKMPLDSLNDDFFKNPTWLLHNYQSYLFHRGYRGGDRMVVRCTAECVISAFHY